MLKVKKIGNKKRVVMFSLLLLAIVALCVAVYFLFFNKINSNKVTKSKNVNYNKPDKKDREDTQERKKEIIDNQTENNESYPQSSTAVSPIITYAGQYGKNLEIEVGGYVSGIVESGGTCTAVFIKDSTTFKKEVSAVANANSVDCPVISVPYKEFSKGTWNVRLIYSSSSYSGESGGKSFEVY